MASTYAEPVWRKCDECDVAYFIAATLNPRNHRWSPIPLSRAPVDVPGNFRIDWEQDDAEVFDRDGVELGAHPIAVYGSGDYRPHNPSHFLDHLHAEEETRQRLHNFRMAMDEED